MILQLIEEVKQIATAKNISISDDITNLTLKKLKNLPFETTSSMHSDFKSKKSNTELKSLTEYIVTEGKKHQILTLTFERLLTELKKRQQTCISKVGQNLKLFIPSKQIDASN
ncbi:MAG: hypothetical protein IPJ43_20790 [Saprospiraceae bacterium]|nr:hypothetical protein [Saprospiraceae bacterium]